MAKIPFPKFYLRLPKSDSPTLISLMVRHNGKRLVYSTGLSVHPSNWNFKTQRPVQQTNRPDLFTVKRKLDDLHDTCLGLSTGYVEGKFTSLEFKVKLDQINGKAENLEKAVAKPERPPFLQFLSLQLDEMERSYGLESSTTKAYGIHAGVIKKFADEAGEFDYEDVDWEFRLKLIDWLATKDFKLSYGNKTLAKLKQFLELARKKKHHSNTSYLGAGWVVSKKKAKGEIPILTQHELGKLAALDLTGAEEKVRDLFLVGAGTGQRFSDYSRYVPNNFFTTMKGVQVLSMISQKTKTPGTVPLTIFPWLIPVLEKYDYHSPKISMQKFNQLIKLLCKEIDASEDVFIVEQFIGRKPNIRKKHVPKYTQISSHSCRRSFATNLYRMGFSLAQIMPMTGHSTESQLKNYIGIDGVMNAEAIVQIMNLK